MSPTLICIYRAGDSPANIVRKLRDGSFDRTRFASPPQTEAISRSNASQTSLQKTKRGRLHTAPSRFVAIWPQKPRSLACNSTTKTDRVFIAARAPSPSGGSQGGASARPSPARPFRCECAQAPSRRDPDEPFHGHGNAASPSPCRLRQ